MIKTLETAENLNIFIDNDTYAISKSLTDYQLIKDTIKSKDEEYLKTLIELIIPYKNKVKKIDNL